MPNSRSIVLNSGNRALLRAFGDGVRIPIGRFRVGDAYNFTPVETETGPSGALVYTGGTEKINIEILDTDELKIAITFTDDIGPFDIGNIVVDLLVEDGYVPFLKWASDIPIPKYPFNKSTGDIGNTLVIQFSEEIKNIDETLDINVLPTIYASLPQYQKETALPPANSLLFQNFIVQTFKTLFRPVLAARRSVDNLLFGTAFMQRIDDPFFGVRDGGIVGQDKTVFKGRYVWGGFLPMQSSDFDKTINGGTLDTPASSYTKTINGGTL